MSLPKPPRHRADAPILFVHPRDEAVDYDKIKLEIEEMKERGEDTTQHPWMIYSGGFSRYDIDAEHTIGTRTARPSDYVDMSRATVWTLKRLPWPMYYEIRGKWERAQRSGERPFDAYLTAAIHGVKKVENLSAELEGPPDKLTFEDVDKLFQIDEELPLDLGLAVYQASMPLTSGENVPSGYGRGPGGK